MPKKPTSTELNFDLDLLDAPLDVARHFEGDTDKIRAFQRAVTEDVIRESDLKFKDPTKVHKILGSSFIAGFGYDKDNAVLRVVLKSGKAFDYFNVPDEIISEFTASFGKAYNKHLKSNYAESEVADWIYPPTK